MATIDDSTHTHVRSMWTEAGIQFRSNLFTENDKVDLHSHTFDHVAIVTHGWLQVKEITPTGEVKEYQVASKDFKTTNPNFNPVGYRILIPKFHQHGFTVIESDGPAEVLCIFPASIETTEEDDEDYVGC